MGLRRFGKIPSPDHEKFWSHVDVNGPFPDTEKYPNLSGRCFEWTASKHPRGYGRFHEYRHRKPIAIKAHRWIWKYTHGEIAEGMQVLHRCDNPSCVNVDHLFLGTPLDNMRDKITKRRDTRGEKVNTAKLNEMQVRVIRRLEEFGIPLKYMGGIFGVTVESVRDAAKRRTWSHV